MCPRPQYIDLTTMGGTGRCQPVRIIFGSVVKSWYISLNVKFSGNRYTDLTYIRGTGFCVPMRIIFGSVI